MCSSTASRSRSSGATGSPSQGRTAPARRRCCGRSPASSRSRAASWRSRRGRASRCTTSARRRRATARCATTCSPGTADLAAVEDELRALEQRDGRRRPRRRRRCAATRRRRRGSSTPGGYDWRDRAASVVRGLGFTDADLDRPLRTFSGGELTRASLARALASQPDLLLLDEPTNHLDIESLEWLEEMLKTIDAAVILVAHDRWFLEAVTTAVLELEARPLDLLPGRLARLAARAGGARDPPGEDGRAPDGAARAARALRRAVPLQGVEGQAGAVEAQADQAHRGGARAGARRPPAHARLRVPEAAALGPRRARRRGPRARARATSRCSTTPTFAIERGEHVALVGPERLGQDDAARDAARPARAGRGQAPARARRRGRVLLAARGRARRARLGARGGDVAAPA